MIVHRQIKPQKVSVNLHHLKSWIQANQRFFFILFIFIFLLLIILPSRPSIQFLNHLSLSLNKLYYRATIQPKVQLNLDISFENLQRLRNLSVPNSIISTDQTTPAQMRYQSNNLSINITSPNLNSHDLPHQSAQYHVTIDDGKTILDANKFSLTQSTQNNLVDQWLFIQALQQQGLATPIIDFINLNLNGDNQGIYTLVEQPNKLLLERNQFREGPIFQFNQINSSNLTSSQTFQDSTPPPNYYNLIEPHQWETIQSSPALYQQFKSGLDKLASYKDGQLEPQKVLDYPSFATYLAMAELFGVDHQQAWAQIKLYYNPLTGLFEPIAYDIEVGQSISQLNLSHIQSDLFQRLLSDPNFSATFIQKLSQISQQDFVNQLLTEHQSDLDYYQKLIRQNNPDYTFSPHYLLQNASIIRQSLIGNNSLKGYYSSDDSPSNTIYIQNLHQFPLNLTSVTDQSDTQLMSSPDQLIKPFHHQTNTSLHPIKLNSPVSDNPSSLSNLQLNYHIHGTSNNQVSTLEPFPAYTQISFLNPTNPDQLDYINFDSQNQVYQFRPGTWSLDQIIVIPQNTGLVISPSTHIDLTQGGGIISYSPVNIQGDPNYPISFTSSDNQGMGLLIINGQSKSTLAHTMFDNLDIVKHQGIAPTGAITFYNSPVDVNHVTFSNSRSEDALNLVISPYNLNHTHFHNAMYDALDVDFSHGTITQSSFSNIGNDALDFSGSNSEINNLTIRSFSDKGISIGENSRIEAKQLDISQGTVGVAVKDLSHADLDQINLSQLQIGIAVYQKKPEFGSAQVTVGEINTQEVTATYLVETGSQITTPQQIIKGDQSNLADRFP